MAGWSMTSASSTAGPTSCPMRSAPLTKPVHIMGARKSICSRPRRHRQRLGGRADRRLPERESGNTLARLKEGHVGIRAPDRDRDIPRPRPPQLRPAAGSEVRRGGGPEVRPAERRSRLPAWPPSDDPGPVEPVPLYDRNPQFPRPTSSTPRPDVAQRRRACSTAEITRTRSTAVALTIRWPSKPFLAETTGDSKWPTTREIEKELWDAAEGQPVLCSASKRSATVLAADDGPVRRSGSRSLSPPRISPRTITT